MPEYCRGMLLERIPRPWRTAPATVAVMAITAANRVGSQHDWFLDAIAIASSAAVALSGGRPRQDLLPRHAPAARHRPGAALRHEDEAHPGQEGERRDAAILGTTAGSQDVSAGVFRDLVVTGRSRRTPFRVRFPGAWRCSLRCWPRRMGSQSAGRMHSPAAWRRRRWTRSRTTALSAGLLGAVTLAAAVSLGAILPSRVATGVLTGWNAIVAGLLTSIPNLGHARDAIDVAAAARFAPGLYKNAVPMSAGTALAVLALWVAVALRAGAWWTKRIDA